MVKTAESGITPVNKSGSMTLQFQNQDPGNKKTTLGVP